MATCVSLVAQATVKTIAELREINTIPLPDGYGVSVLGYHEAGDGGGGTFAYDRSSTAVDDSGTIIAPDDGAAGRWQRVYSGPLSVRWFGAKGDGTTDDTATVVAAWTKAAATPQRLHFPAGTYSVTSDAPLLRLATGMSVTGDGMDSTTVHWIDDNAASANGTISLIDGPSSGTADRVSISDIHFRGNHDDDYASVSSYPLLLRDCANATIHRVKVSYSRAMGIVVRDALAVDVSECFVTHCARDGINVSDCSFARITGNRIEYVDDDGIAIHSEYVGTKERGAVIVGNVLRLCQGIVLMGATSVTITGNTLELCYARGVLVGLSWPGEGLGAVSSVVIANNVIKNILDRAEIDGLSSNASYIQINGSSSFIGSGDNELAALPGEHDSATGTVVVPYPYFWTQNSGDDSQPVAPPHNISVTGNLCVRDIYPTANVSDFGFGSFYLRTGPLDPEVTAAAYSGTACWGIALLGGIMRNVFVSGNVFAGMGIGAFVDASTRLRNTVFSDNAFYDLASYGIAFSGSNTQLHDIDVSGNLFDLDPYHLHANRSTDGSWLASGAPYGLFTQSAKGLLIRGNKFKNLCIIVDGNPSSVGTVGSSRYGLGPEANLAFGQPVAAGFSTSNKGVGSVPRGNTVCLVYTDSDPNSATYGDVLNYCALAADGVPTSGFYLSGHIVWNNNPTSAAAGPWQNFVLGWVRWTSGSSHTIDVDWKTIRVGSQSSSYPLSVRSVGTFAAPITTTPYTLSGSNCYDGILYYGATGEIDLPAGLAGMVISIISTGSFTITLDPNGSEVIVREGVTQTGGVSAVWTATAGQQLRLSYDGSAWVTLGVDGSLAEGT